MVMAGEENTHGDPRGYEIRLRATEGELREKDTQEPGEHSGQRHGSQISWC